VGLVPPFVFFVRAIILAMSFIDKIKEKVTGYLASQKSQYLLTEGGLKILILDHEAVDKTKTGNSVWSEKAEAGAGVWNDKNKSS